MIWLIILAPQFVWAVLAAPVIWTSAYRLQSHRGVLSCLAVAFIAFIMFLVPLPRDPKHLSVQPAFDLFALFWAVLWFIAAFVTYSQIPTAYRRATDVAGTLLQLGISLPVVSALFPLVRHNPMH